MKKYTNSHFLLLAAFSILSTSACQNAEKNQTGSEFIPEMAHSIAYEANIYSDYSLNSFPQMSEVDKRDLVASKLPVEGTIPRGYAGDFFDTHKAKSGEKAETYGISVPRNGAVPYYYEDTEEDRQRAIAEIVMNPYPITEEALKHGKELYDIFCGICHGPAGDGLGYLVREDGGKYPAAPANFLMDEHINASNGRYYHAIMHGKGVMGAYADKLNYEERWQVIHYIRELQATKLELEYSPTANTLNQGAVPMAAVEAGASISSTQPVADGPEDSAANTGN